MKITHAKVSAQPDSGDPTLVQADDWNDDHVLDFPIGELAAGITFASGVLTLDLAAAEYFDYTLTANVTSLVLSNPPATGFGKSFMLLIRQHASSPKTFAWPVSFRWEGAAPAISATNGAVDLLSATMVDATGAKWDTTLSKDRV